MNYTIEKTTIKRHYCEEEKHEPSPCIPCNACNSCNDKCSCKKKKSPCEEDCVEDCPPIDASNIRYRIKCDGAEYSDLEQLGIHKGDNLDRILDVFSRNILNLNFIQTPNINGAKSLEQIFLQILERLENVEIENQLLHSMIHNINYNEELNNLKFPRLVDSASLGFTTNTELKNIIQLLVNKHV